MSHIGHINHDVTYSPSSLLGIAILQPLVYLSKWGDDDAPLGLKTLNGNAQYRYVSVVFSRRYDFVGGPYVLYSFGQ